MKSLYSQYRGGLFSFPDHDIDPKLKLKPQFNLDFSKAIFASWIEGRTGITYTASLEFNRLRKYGAGEQDPNQYMDVLVDDEESNDGERKGWVNTNWDIFSVAPKFKNVVIGLFEAQEHDIVASATDGVSSLEREEAKWSKWFESVHKQDLDEVRRNMGLPPSEGEYLPQTIQELNLFQDLGGFKLAKEHSIETGVDYTFYISDWKEIKRQIFSDAIDIGVVAVKDYVDINTQKVRVRYADPQRTVIQYSRHNDHRNSTWGGEIIKMPLGKLRHESQLPEDALKDIALKYSGYEDNTLIGETPINELRSDDGTYKYDYLMIDVLDCEYISVNSEYKVRRINDRGDEMYYDGEWGKMYDGPKRRTEIKTKQQVYRCKWIVGTDYIYDYGYQFDVPRPGRNEVRLSYHVYRMRGRSMMSIMVPNLDNLQLAWLKFQNALARSSAPGLAVEYSSLQNMLLGGNKMQPLDILTIRRDTGDLVYRATTHRGQVNNPHAGKPVQELEGGMGRSLDEFIRIFNLDLNIIRDLTGINQIADASTPDPEQSVGGSELAVAATNNALRYLYSGYLSIKERTALNISLRLQIVIKYNKRAYKGYMPVLGETNMKSLSIGAEVVDVDYAIKVEARPDEQMKQVVRTAALQAMNPDRDGHIGIEMPDYLMIERLMDLGNLKLAQALLAERSRANKQEQKQRNAEAEELASQREQKSLAIKEKIEEKKSAREHQQKMELERQKSENKINEENNKHRNKVREIQIEKSIDAELDNLNNDNQEGKPPIKKTA
jgi:hypothetical protein